MTSLPVGAETLDSLAEFGNAAGANATSEAGTPRGANFSGAAAGNYSITAGGTDFWGASDNGSFIYDADRSRAAGENFSAIVRSVSVAGNDAESLAGEWGRTGIMARKTPAAPGSAYAAHIRKSGGDPGGTNPADTLIQGRSSDGADTERGPGENGEHRNFAENTLNGSVRNTPIWLGLHRFEGNWYSTWAPDAGGTPGAWSTAIRRDGTPHLSGPVWVGLAHQSHNINPIVNTAVFEKFSVGAFDADLGFFPTSVACSVALTASGATLTASGTELGTAVPRDVAWEVRYLGAPVSTPGFINADIYLAGNAGNLGAFDTLVANNEPAGSTQIEQILWASNAYTTTNAAGVNLFAEAVPGSFTGGQDNYGVNLTGEIHIPSDANRGGQETVSFHDGVDDFAYLEIDGVALINDNNWTNTAGTANNGGAQATLDVSDAKYNDGEWVSFRMVTWEGGGGDDANLVWDALDRTGTDSVTGATDGSLTSYTGVALGDGAQVNFTNDASDMIPALNFRVQRPALLNTVSGSGQPNARPLPALPAGTLFLEVYANGELCNTLPVTVSVGSADFTASNVFTVVLKDAGSGGISDVNPTSLTMTLNGTAITPAIMKTGTSTTLTYTFPAPPIPYTNHTFTVSGTKTAATGGQALNFTITRRSLPFLDVLRAGLPAPPNATVGWDYMEFLVAGTLGGNLGAGAQGFIDAQTVISTAAAPSAQAAQPYVNHSDPDTNAISGDWVPDLPILLNTPGTDDNQYVTYARTTITIAAGDVGDYTFRITGDDGYGLRIMGASFASVAGSNVNELDPRDRSVVYFPEFTGNSNAFAIANFPTAGNYVVEFFGFEGGGGSFQEISWVKGAFTNLNQSTGWKLLGNTSAVVPVSKWGDIPVAALPPAPDGAGWSALIYYNATVGNLANTLNFLRGADPALATAVTLAYLNHSDNGGNAGRFDPTDPFPGDPLEGGDTDNIGMIARAFVVAPSAGNYTLQVRSDDGFLLRWADPGTKFTSINGGGTLHGSALNEVYFADGTGDSDTRATAFLTAGVHELLFVWWEGGGGSHFEISSAPGIAPSQDGPYELLSTTVSTTNLYLGAAPATAESIPVTNFTFNPATGVYSLTFVSTVGSNYRLEYSTAMEGGAAGTPEKWNIAPGAPTAGAAGTTTITGNISALQPAAGGVLPVGAPRTFFRVRRL